MRNRWWPWLLLVLAMVPALLISDPHTPSGSMPPTENVSEAIFSNPKTLDPALASSESDWAVASNIFQPLFLQQATGGIVPNLVSQYAISGNELTLDIKPLPLPNNTRLTAAVVAGALARPLWPLVGSTYAQSLLSSVVGAPAVIAGRSRYLSGVTVTGESILTIRLTHPVTRAFLKVLANPALSIVPVADQLRGGASWQLLNLDGTGGYKLADWEPGGALTFSLTRGAGPHTMALQEFGSFQQALLSYQNGSVSFVPVSPSTLSQVPVALLKDVRPLPQPGNLFLVYRAGANNISRYSLLNPTRWVDKSFRGRIAPLATDWPPEVPAGKPMTVYVNEDLPQALQLADTLARLEPDKVTVQAVSLTTLQSLATHNQIGAYIGQADLFRSGIMMPLAPLSSLWLYRASFPHVRVYANGALNWHSLTEAK